MIVTTCIVKKAMSTIYFWLANQTIIASLLATRGQIATCRSLQVYLLCEWWIVLTSWDLTTGIIVPTATLYNAFFFIMHSSCIIKCCWWNNKVINWLIVWLINKLVPATSIFLATVEISRLGSEFSSFSLNIQHWTKRVSVSVVGPKTWRSKAPPKRCLLMEQLLFNSTTF